MRNLPFRLFLKVSGALLLVLLALHLASPVPPPTADDTRADSVIAGSLRVTPPSVPDLHTVPGSQRISLVDIHLASTPYSSEDWLWLARAVRSESDRLKEQRDVAWVIRNRLHSKRWPNTSVRDVILQPGQFSAFSFKSGVREKYTNLTPASSNSRPWVSAQQVALEILLAPRSANPLPGYYHFYSPGAFPDSTGPPDWVYTKPGLPRGRFVFLKH